MKMFGSKSVSSYLFYVFRFASLCSFILLLFILLSFLFGNYEVQDGRFTIPFPLFSYFDIKGVYKTSIITSITLILIYSGGFLYSLSMILKSFKSAVLFNESALRHLNILAIINLLVFPIVYLSLRLVILNISIMNGIHNLILSLIFGVFLLFVAAIFKRGLKVQNENDLTI
ncbi:DUF2975 domain-containing protein [Maribacter cobaltidurans]|uniref:DUF2975 domain-containing protein n=1 Tax=Maribacter cobaltidurans TaxID=1178778 RepID=A0A223V5R6_9FLAO|nr:hypothetical protein CJ263_09630 [Maribacter cobaltidurans]